MSDHSVEVVKVRLNKHPNADRLSIVKVHGFQVVVRTEDWKDGELGAYIPPDSVVPDKEEYAFLEGHLRIKAHRYRGEWSMGLLVKAPRGSKEGDNVAEILEVTHYEPPLRGRGMTEHAADFASPPPLGGPVYDVENLLRYDDEIPEGLAVVVTEKIHGANIRMTFQNGKFHVASRRFYRKENYRLRPKDWWEKIKFWFMEYLGNQSLEVPTMSEYWRAFKRNPALMDIVRRFEGMVFYGELYGNTQARFSYDADPPTDKYPDRDELIGGWNKIRIFDILDPKTHTYLPWEEVANIVPSNLLVPVDYIGPFSMDKVKELGSAPSNLTKTHIREGVVVKPLVDMWSSRLGGRLILKYVSPMYLEKS